MFKPMLGASLDPKYPVNFPVFASVKLDGIRCTVVDGVPKTRSLKPIPNLHIRKLLSERCMDGMDLELICGDPVDPLCYNKTFRAVMTVDGEPEVDFYIFDYVKMPTVSFRNRYEYICTRLDLPKNAVIVRQVHVGTQKLLDDFYAEVTSDGHEGLILKSPEGVYKYGRSTAREQLLLKLKPEHDSEFAILDAYEAMENTNEAFTNELGRTDRTSHAEGKVPNGMLGGFLAKDIHSGVEFNCAPGKLTHEERTTLWKEWVTNPDRIKKLIGKYRSFPIGVLEKPRHPRWIGWRATEDL